MINDSKSVNKYVVAHSLQMFAAHCDIFVTHFNRLFIITLTVVFLSIQHTTVPLFPEHWTDKREKTTPWPKLYSTIVFQVEVIRLMMASIFLTLQFFSLSFIMAATSPPGCKIRITDRGLEMCKGHNLIMNWCNMVNKFNTY